uniref:Uncharacterized protein n=1 Tax=Oryza sativa subsp. japonica TaxID=39947 RepID=Q69RM0_ORYSJ|nr:hypothetical protein [Oryza sativa Japonica Group]
MTMTVASSDDDGGSQCDDGGGFGTTMMAADPRVMAATEKVREIAMTYWFENKEESLDCFEVETSRSRTSTIRSPGARITTLLVENQL